jgi:predicted dehydrogenase
MATSVAEADSMIKAAENARKKLFIHQNYRFFDEFWHLRETIDSGLLGEVFQIRAHWGHYGRRNDWQTLKKNGGGVLNNTGPHPLDYLLQLLDAACVDVWSSMRHVKDAGDCEDHVKLLLRGANGRVAELELSTATASPAVKWTILGSCGALWSDGKTSRIRRYDPSKVPPLRVVDGYAPERRYGVFGAEESIPWEEKEVPCVPAVKHGNFYDNVSEVLLKGHDMVVKPEHAREIIRVIGLAKKGTEFA